MTNAWPSSPASSPSRTTIPTPTYRQSSGGYLGPASASVTCGDCEHTVSLWTWEYEGGSIEGRAGMNSGGLDGSADLVKEYMPFGSSNIPVVQK